MGYERKDPLGVYQNGYNGSPTSPALQFTDQPYQNYQPVRPGLQDYFPGFTFSGPLLPKWKDRVTFFLAFNPEFSQFQEHVNYAAASAINGGNACPTAVCTFSQNTQTYYTNARVDVSCHEEHPRVRLLALPVSASGGSKLAARRFCERSLQRRHCIRSFEFQPQPWIYRSEPNG